MKLRAERALTRASVHNFQNRSYFVPSSCNESHPFVCHSSGATQQGFSCFNFTQIGDGRINCAGAIDERNRLRHCSQPSSMLGVNFLCPLTNTCIPYLVHCWEKNRCPNRSDDEHWCERQHRAEDCSNLNDFVCFDGRCLKQGRCNLIMQCPFGEDEYNCDYYSSSYNILINYRRRKWLAQGSTLNTLHFSPYPTDSNITQLNSQSIITNSSTIVTNLNTSSSLSPYWCNRGLGVLMMTNGSIVCFCLAQYYGEKCEYHQDRLSVVIHLDLSQSISSSSSNLLKLLVLFLFDNDEILQHVQFHLHPLFQSTNSFTKKKFFSHFVYPRSSFDLQERRKRFFNRSDLLLRHPYSIRMELYQTPLMKEPFLIGVWNYPLHFDHLPVTRLAKVLRLTSPVDQWRNPCSSHPCHPNEECHPLIDDTSRFICLCPTNFTGPDCSRRDPQCDTGYCLSGSLCQPDRSQSLSSPFCLCPSNLYGRRCSIEQSACLSSPCLHGGSCFPDSHPDRVICLCTREYSGARCQWQRASIHLSLSTDLSFAGIVIQ